MNPWKILLVALAVFAIAGGACGDDDDDAEATEPSGGETAAPSATAEEDDEPSGETVRLGFSAWPGWFPWQVTEEAGIFDEVGLDVELTWFDLYTDSLTALAVGQLDANSQTLNDTISSVAAGADQVIVLVNDNSTGNDQIIVTDEIQSIEDLAGKTIGVEIAVVDNYLLLLGLESAGLNPDDVNIQGLPTDAAAAAFAAGQLDGVGAFAPFTTTALEREGSHVLFSSADFPGAIPDHLVVSREMVEERPGDVQKLIEAWFLTLEYIEENPDEALEIMAERAAVSIEDYQSYDEGTTIFSVEDNLEAFADGDDFTSLLFAAEDIAAFMLDQGLIEEEVDVADLFDASFVEAYAEAN